MWLAELSHQESHWSIHIAQEANKWALSDTKGLPGIWHACYCCRFISYPEPFCMACWQWQCRRSVCCLPENHRWLRNLHSDPLVAILIIPSCCQPKLGEIITMLKTRHSLLTNGVNLQNALICSRGERGAMPLVIFCTLGVVGSTKPMFHAWFSAGLSPAKHLKRRRRRDGNISFSIRNRQSIIAGSQCLHQSGSKRPLHSTHADIRRTLTVFTTKAL